MKMINLGIPAGLRRAAVCAGLLYAASILHRFGVTWEALRLLCLGLLLLNLTVSDITTGELPDPLVSAAACTALLRLFDEGINAIPHALAGAAVIFLGLLALTAILSRILGRNPMGGGDIKLLTALALHFGALQMLLLLFLACVTGLLFAAIFRPAGDEIPFGPFLALAAWMTALVGKPVMEWYLGLFL